MSAATPPVEKAKVEAFAERMLQVLNHGALTLMTSVGHRTGLFDAMAEMPPSTSAQIAERAGLNERYVREWLGAMVTGRIVIYDPEANTYHLPAEHAAVLTRDAVPDNLASVMQWVPVLGSVEDEIVECFRRGGGVPYSAYKRFHEVMAEESGQTVVAGLFEHILPLVPRATERLQKGIDVLDVGCGSGYAILAMAERFPDSRFVGYDLSDEATARGLAEAERRGLSNVRLEARDVSNIGGQAAFDLITAFDAIHDQAQPDKVLAEISAALRPDGTFLMQDIAGSSHVHNNLEHPVAPFLYTISCMHCMTVSLQQGGAGLGAMWGQEKAVEMLGEAGLGNVEVKELPHDFINKYYIARKA